MRTRTFVACALGLVAAWGAVPAEASRARVRLHACSGFETGSVRVNWLKTDSRCGSARHVLRTLLADGLGGLPKPKAHSGKWGCRKSDANRVCKRSPRRRPGARHRIVFHAERIAPIRPPPPPGGLPAEVQACVEMWNGDTLASGYYGVHFYEPPPTGHAIRQGWVFKTSSQPSRCAVVFVVPATDAEYGDDGLVGVPGDGWDSMLAFFGGQAPQIQGQAAANANVSLDSAGRIAAL
jgi:hypothetical protein